MEAAESRRGFLISKVWIQAVVLFGLLVIVALAARRLLRGLRLYPANFPAPTPSSGLKLAGRE